MLNQSNFNFNCTEKTLISTSAPTPHLTEIIVKYQSSGVSAIHYIMLSLRSNFNLVGRILIALTDLGMVHSVGVLIFSYVSSPGVTCSSKRKLG